MQSNRFNQIRMADCRFDCYNDDHDFQELREEINKALGALLEREREVIELRYGLNFCGKHTLQKIGDMKNLSQERIRQIEKKAMRKLSHKTRRILLEPFLEMTL
jgi:RNA polymerase sigma factor (sigma-70 family)